MKLESRPDQPPVAWRDRWMPHVRLSCDRQRFGWTIGIVLARWHHGVGWAIAKFFDVVLRSEASPHAW